MHEISPLLTYITFRFKIEEINKETCLLLTVKFVPGSKRTKLDVRVTGTTSSRHEQLQLVSLWLYEHHLFSAMRFRLVRGTIKARLRNLVGSRSSCTHNISYQILL